MKTTESPRAAEGGAAAAAVAAGPLSAAVAGGGAALRPFSPAVAVVGVSQQLLLLAASGARAPLLGSSRLSSRAQAEEAQGQALLAPPRGIWTSLQIARGNGPRGAFGCVAARRMRIVAAT